MGSRTRRITSGKTNESGDSTSCNCGREPDSQSTLIGRQVTLAPRPLDAGASTMR